MNVYTYIGFKGIHTSLTAAVIAAPTVMEAVSMLRSNLKHLDLEQDIHPEDIKELDLSMPVSRILQDGDC